MLCVTLNIAVENMEKRPRVLICGAKGGKKIANNGAKHGVPGIAKLARPKLGLGATK